MGRALQVRTGKNEETKRQLSTDSHERLNPLQFSSRLGAPRPGQVTIVAIPADQSRHRHASPHAACRVTSTSSLSLSRGPAQDTEDQCTRLFTTLRNPGFYAVSVGSGASHSVN